MKIVRTILAIVVGAIVAVLPIAATHTINYVLFKPAGAPGLDDVAKVAEWFEALKTDPDRMNAWIKGQPIEALLLVVAGWQLGAFLGGAMSALIAGRARLVHAGVIGALILAPTIYISLQLKWAYGIALPNWMIVAGLLLPLPVSLLAGKLVAMLFPPAQENPPSPPAVSIP